MLELDDIQGNILAGFNTDFELMLGLTWTDGNNLDILTPWLAARAPELTSVAEIRASRAAMKLSLNGPPLVWLSLAISERLMTKILPGVIFNDEAFRRGMPRRSGTLLGDRTPVTDWKVGGLNNSVDVLLIVASNNREAAEFRGDELVSTAASAGLTTTYREMGIKIGGREHFGFRDGISQPTVKGVDEAGEMEPGHFVYGYPKLENGQPVTVYVDPHEITKNGSLLVLRRLEQDVEMFRGFCASEAERNKVVWPGLTGEHVQAMLVGRWPSGAKVSVLDNGDPGPMPDENAFDFSDDSNGLSCPFGAHIRKVNPRKGPRDIVDVPRFLRRGIPFGSLYHEAPDEKRGLLFVCFQTSIVDGFETITSKWMNTDNRPVQAAGNDLLVGRSNGARSTTLKSPFGSVVISISDKNWVIPTGGAYLFAPGKKGLAKFIIRPPIPFNHRLKRSIINVKDYLNI